MIVLTYFAGGRWGGIFFIVAIFFKGGGVIVTFQNSCIDIGSKRRWRHVYEDLSISRTGYFGIFYLYVFARKIESDSIFLG